MRGTSSEHLAKKGLQKESITRARVAGGGIRRLA